MTVQLNTTGRSNMLDQIEATAGATALMRLFTGAQPANCAAADSGTKVAEGSLPADWMAAAGGGTKAKSATAWTLTGTAPGGVAAHFRIYDSTGTTCHIQGSVGMGSGDLSLDNTNIATGQVVTIATFTLTAGNP